MAKSKAKPVRLRVYAEVNVPITPRLTPTEVREIREGNPTDHAKAKIMRLVSKKLSVPMMLDETAGSAWFRSVQVTHCKDRCVDLQPYVF